VEVVAVVRESSVAEEVNPHCRTSRRSIARPHWIDQLPVLGVGLGFRRPLARQIVESQSEIDFLEIITEHYLDPTEFQIRELMELQQRFPLIPHGLSLSPGTSEDAPVDYLDSVASLVDRVKAPWWSDHLAVTRVGRIDIGHLSPVQFTEEALAISCENILRATKRIRAPFIIENIAYNFQLPGAEMSEGGFLTRLLESTDSGLLLDLMNLHANATNHKYDPFEFLSEIPLERVVQVHIIGGHFDQGVLVDSHSHSTPGEVWEMLDYVSERTVINGVLLEWDDHFPDMNTILADLAEARTILSRRGHEPGRVTA
jgi:uncharacterized protein (UPF0276 family)